MDDIEATLRGELDRAGRAKAILNTPIIKESFEELERYLIEGLIATAADDSAKREKLHMMLVYGRKWRNTFETLVETGKMAEIQLAEKRKFKLFNRGN